MPISRIRRSVAGFFLLASAGLLAQQAPQQPTGTPEETRELSVTVGKSLLIDSPVQIQRIAVGNGDVAEATATTPQEVLVNGKMIGETSLIVWQQDGNRLIFDLSVLRNNARVEAVRRQMKTEFAGQDIQLDFENDAPAPVLRGVAKDMTAADRAVQLASTLGRPVNLLRVTVPPTDTQVLLHVRFADVDRSASQQLGLSFISGEGNTLATAGTGQFGPAFGSGSVSSNAPAGSGLSLSQVLNVFLFRKDLDLGAAIQALQSRNLLQTLAEPNLLAINGHTASFLAGGEFPYPTIQAGATLGAVTIAYREFGVRINFVPVVTPRGTIRMDVSPEVSNLDYSNSLVFNGFTIPAISSRKISTQVELQSGQSFAIAGLLDNRVTETLNKIPGLGDIPFFGKLFRSRSESKNNTELLVIVTPEIVRPIPAGQPVPELKQPKPFLEPNTAKVAPQTPPVSVTGPAPAAPTENLPVEELIKSMQPVQQNTQTPQTVQYIPLLVSPGSAPAAAQPAAPAAAPQPATPAPAKP